MLTDMCHILNEDEYFFLDDSACFGQSCLKPLYDAPMPQSPEDYLTISNPVLALPLSVHLEKSSYAGVYSGNDYVVQSTQIY